MRAAAMRDLQQIAKIADRLAKRFTDEQMYYLIGGIRVNAEDALGALEAEQRVADLNALFGRAT
jgi:hypothetical protein